MCRMKLVGGDRKCNTFFCDCGASVSLMKLKVLPRNAIVRFGSFEAKGPSGESIPILGQAVVRFGRFGFEFEHTFWLTDGLDISTDILLGLDFFLRFKFDVSTRHMALKSDYVSYPLLPVEDTAEIVRAVFPARSMQPESRYTVTSDNATERAGNEVGSILKVAAALGTRSTPLGEQVNDKEKEFLTRKGESKSAEEFDECSVHTKHKHTIPARSQAAVAITAPKSRKNIQGLYVVEPILDVIPGVVCEAALLEIEKGGTAHIILTNMTELPIIVKKNTTVGHLVQAFIDARPPDIPTKEEIHPTGEMPSTADTKPPRPAPRHFMARVVSGAPGRPQPAPPVPSTEHGEVTITKQVNTVTSVLPTQHERQNRSTNHSKRESEITNQPEYESSPSREDIIKTVKLDHLKVTTRENTINMIEEFKDIFSVSDETI